MLTIGRPARGHGIIAMILGALMLLAGLGAWIFTSSALKEQGIKVAAVTPENPGRYAGRAVTGPLTAYAQAEAIKHHVGTPFAELNKDNFATADEYQAARTTAQTGAFMQASLFTSVLAFGVSLLVMGLGLLFLLVGHAILRMSPRLDDSAVGYAPAGSVAPMAVGTTGYAPTTYETVETVVPETVTYEREV